jgi:hypothetical protein
MAALALAALLCAAAASCAGRANGSDDLEGTMEGVIAAVETGPSGAVLTVDVPGAPEPRVVLIVPPGTEVLVERADGTSAPGGAADLAAGARIVARHTGAAMRSLPPQYHATHVRVVRGS